MKVKELHKDIERYLKEGCFSPNEIYDNHGRYYRMVYEDDEIREIARKDDVIISVWQDQLIIWQVSLDNEKVIDAFRFDATNHNIDLSIKVTLDQDTDDTKFDTFAKPYSL